MSICCTNIDMRSHLTQQMLEKAAINTSCMQTGNYLLPRHIPNSVDEACKHLNSSKQVAKPQLNFRISTQKISTTNLNSNLHLPTCDTLKADLCCCPIYMMSPQPQYHKYSDFRALATPNLCAKEAAMKRATDHCLLRLRGSSSGKVVS